MNKAITIIVLLFCIGAQHFLMAIEVKPLKKFTLSDKDGIIERGYSFIVTEDDRVLVSDMKAGNIKIYDKNGNRTNVFGRKGIGPNEFIRPLMSTYRKPYAAFMDYGRDMIFIYKRKGQDNLEFVQKIFSQYLGYSFLFLDDDTFLIAGDKRSDKNRRYSLYSYNFKNDKCKLILPSEVAYFCSSREVFEKDNDERLSFIGYFLFIDASEDYIYLVWKGNYEVIRINRKSMEVSRFGKKSPKYVKPYYTTEAVKAFRQKNHRLLYKLDRPMSFTHKIFVTKNRNVGVVYTGPYNDNGSLPVMLQLYSANGKYLKEVQLINAKASHHYEVYFYFKKSNNRFYIMDTETSKTFDQTYKIHEFQVEE
jgi:hypothetical protein